jgi:POTRA domain, FtsQ-type/Cell division protein FtsQ
MTGRSGGGRTKTRDPRGAGRTNVVVDPRMRSRRIGVLRDKGRRRLRRVGLVVAAVAVVVGMAGLTRTSLLDVDRVTVRGVTAARADEARSTAGVSQGEPLVDVDSDVVAARVEDLPWVESARVQRSWPSTVRIEVTARVPVASVQVSERRTAFVDAEGWVISVETHASGEPADEPADEPDQPTDGPTTDPGGTVVVTGVDERIAAGDRLDADARDALSVAAAAAERMPGVIAAISTELDAELVDGGTVRFGSTEDLADKVTAVKTVLSDVDTTCLAVIDVRVPGSPALTRHQGCS